MKKEWSNPEIKSLTINQTEYHPESGNCEDGAYKSYDGLYNLTTYGPSDGNNAGTPTVTIK